MARFLFYTDLHLSGQSPRHRVDDFPNTLLNKLEETYAIARSQNCDFVVFGGDLFNTHRIYSYDVINRAMDIICDGDIDTYSVVGQHDLNGYNKNTFKTSALAFVTARCGRFHILWEPVAVNGVHLCPSHVWDTLEDSSDWGMRSDCYNVLVAHHLLTNKKAMFDVVNTTEYVKTCECPYDLVLSGDLHDGYETHETEGVWFCNPGSLARRATNDAHRHPQVAVIETVGPGLPPAIDIHRLECAESGDIVFGESIAEVVRAKGDFDADSFVDDILAFEAESSDVHELVQKIGSERGIRSEVLRYLAGKKDENN